MVFFVRKPFVVCLHLYDTTTDLEPSEDRDVLEEAGAREKGKEALRDLSGKWSGSYISSALTAMIVDNEYSSLTITMCHSQNIVTLTCHIDDIITTTISLRNKVTQGAWFMPC